MNEPFGNPEGLPATNGAYLASHASCRAIPDPARAALCYLEIGSIQTLALKSEYVVYSPTQKYTLFDPGTV